MIKILHTADWHANSNYEIFKLSYNQIYNYVKDNDIDLVIIAGDVFDSRMFAGNNYSDILNDIKNIGDYCSVLIPYGTPSHDFKGCFAPFETSLIKSKYPIVIINNNYCNDEDIISHTYYLDEVNNKKTLCNYNDVNNSFGNENNTVIISGSAWVSKNRWLSDTEIKNLSTAEQTQLYTNRTNYYFNTMKRFNESLKHPSIWMGHLQLENISFSKGQDISSDNHPMRWVQGLADKVVLGHIHKADDLYCGSIYNKTWGEMEEKSFRVISIEDNKIVSDERIKIDTPMMIKVQCDMDEYKTIKKTNMVDDVSVTGNKVWLRITVGNKKTINVEKELEYWKDICDMRLEVEKIKTEAVQRLSDYDKSMGLVDKFKLFCNQKGTEASEFQINKLIELEENK